MKPIYIIVEGIPGSGKTTLTHALAERLNVQYLKSLTSNTERGDRLRMVRDECNESELVSLYTVDLLFDELRVRNLLTEGISIVRDKTFTSSISHIYTHTDTNHFIFNEYLNMLDELASEAIKPDLFILLNRSYEDILTLSSHKDDSSEIDRLLWGNEQIFDKQANALILACKQYFPDLMEITQFTDTPNETVDLIVGELEKRGIRL
jgi:thymidylate kinase